MCKHKNAVVLAIDDNLDNLFLLDLIFIDCEYRLEKACCGTEGLAKIHELVPDLIILDMMMPDMTGLEVINSIKAHHHLSKIPIIVCTANLYIDKNDLIGIAGICYKPFDINCILEQVNALIF